MNDFLSRRLHLIFEGISKMNNLKLKPNELACLIQILQEDPLIKKRILELLQLSSYERRFELNIWLEQLRQRNASENLLYVISILFDDKIAKKVLTIINNRRTLNN